MPPGAPQRWLNCKKRTCPVCGDHWAGDIKVLLLENLNNGYGGAVDMVTITAPGRAVLAHEDGPGGVVLKDDAARWNRTAPARWSEMWAQAKYLLARRKYEKPVLLAYVIAYQKRGVIITTWRSLPAITVFSPGLITRIPQVSAGS